MRKTQTGSNLNTKAQPQRCRAATKRNTHHGGTGDTEKTKSKSKTQHRGHRELRRALRSGKENSIRMKSKEILRGPRRI
jgi:hypothetical protein